MHAAFDAPFDVSREGRELSFHVLARQDAKLVSHLESREVVVDHLYAGRIREVEATVSCRQFCVGQCLAVAHAIGVDEEEIVALDPCRGHEVTYHHGHLGGIDGADDAYRVVADYDGILLHEGRDAQELATDALCHIEAVARCREVAYFHA